VIPPFHIHRKRLTPSQGASAKTRHHAIADGRPIAAGKAGAAVLKFIADDETGEASSIEVIERFGEIPEESEESVRALRVCPLWSGNSSPRTGLKRCQGGSQDAGHHHQERR
jgi:hypothetical protein